MTTTDEFALSDEQLDSFRRNGFLGPLTIYPPEEMAELWKSVQRQALDRTHAAYPESTRAWARRTSPTTTGTSTSTSWPSHVCQPEDRRPGGQRARPGLLCWRTEFFPKYPGDEGTDWHQADTFANASRQARRSSGRSESREFGGTITVWTAFTEATVRDRVPAVHPRHAQQMNYDETKTHGLRPERDQRQRRRTRRQARLLRLRLPAAADRPGLDAGRVRRPSRW